MSIALLFCRFAALLIAAFALVPTAVAQSKTFAWDDSFRSGDCGSDTVSVVLDDNGVGHLKSISWTRSTHSGDYWWWSLSGYDKDGIRLWSIPWHKGPRMDDGEGGPPPRYNNDFDFQFPAGQFQNTETVRLGSKC
jgi:hypothetical protein